LSNDKELHQKYSENAEKAGQNYKKKNARKLVDLYLTD